jgi:hypothetical protein
MSIRLVASMPATTASRTSTSARMRRTNLPDHRPADTPHQSARPVTQVSPARMSMSTIRCQQSMRSGS